MTDTAALTNEAARLLEDLRLLLEKGGQFVLEQAPPLAREIVTYGRVANTTSLAICLTIVAVCLHFWFKRVPKILSDKEKLSHCGELYGRHVAQMIAHGLFGVVFSILAFCEMFDAIKAWFAPRLYLLEYVGRLINGECK